MNSLSFMYSRIQNVQGHRQQVWTDQIDEEVKNERVHRLIQLSDQLAKEYASSLKVKF